MGPMMMCVWNLCNPITFERSTVDQLMVLLAQESKTVFNHAVCGVVTQPLSVIWENVEAEVNCGSAMEKLVLLPVSEHDGYEMKRGW